MGTSRRQPVKIGGLIEKVMSRWTDTAKRYQQRLEASWLEAVGKRIASHSRAEQLRGQKLYVAVENSVWMNELTFLKEKIKMQFNSALPERESAISDIVFKLQRRDPRAEPSPHVPPSGK